MPIDSATQRVVGHNSQARVSQTEARRILARVHGLTATQALDSLRFSAGTVCAPLARVLEQAIVEAEHTFGAQVDDLLVSGSEVGEGEIVTRVRRLAHGKSDWITTRTSDIRIALSVVSSEARGDGR
ncbi:MAG: large ribosomal subunit protein uL22 [Egibacteraceae bacterium]